MIDMHASAPGKIVLCGEYVVLDGVPALGMALDCRAMVTIVANENDTANHVVRCPGLADRPFSFQVADGFELEWQGEAIPDFSLLQRVWKSMEFRPSTGLQLTLNTQALVDANSGSKLGIGSSSALAVALSAAIGSLQGREPDLDAMIAIHRQFQNGRGSGIDVATASSGGVVEYRCGSTAKLCKRNWPDGLEYAILWSGEPASTASKLGAFDASKKGSNSRERLAAASADIARDWQQLDAQAIVGRFVDFVSLLGTFSVDHALGIFEAGHADLVVAATRHGVAYKPCGAGGGDVGIVLSANQGALSDFVTEAMNKGFQLLDCRKDDHGLLIDKTHE